MLSTWTLACGTPSTVTQHALETVDAEQNSFLTTPLCTILRAIVVLLGFFRRKWTEPVIETYRMSAQELVAGHGTFAGRLDDVQ